ncbi:transmembrane signal receptor [Lithospermum erythrorhizon]|uniref:Transmembrane signal receptor n=1 Tax=Lithospermum erythrorhizon TaxID=34254 RepID=A0AAV3NR64_LITER
MAFYSALRCSLLKVLIAICEHQLLAAREFIYYYCPNTTNYTPNSSYEANLRSVLSDLSSNNGANSFFYNTMAGENSPDATYGLLLCRGDVTFDACGECVQTATTEIVQRCKKEKEEIIWYDY